MLIHYDFFLLAPWEVESVKKQYTKVMDAYGCLGVLTLNLGFDRNTGISLS